MDHQNSREKKSKPPFVDESLFRFLTERMTDVVWTVDLNLQTTYVSPSVLQVHGYTPEERIRQDVRDQMTPESYARAMELLAAEIEREQRGEADRNRTMAVEVEYINKDGSTVWMENLVSGIWNADGKPVGLHGVSRDITERKRMERLLQEQERKYRLLTENSTDVIWTMDLNGRFTYISPSVRELAGFTPEEAMAIPFAEYVVPEDYDAVMAQIATELAKPPSERARVRTLELRQYAKDGSIIDIEVSSSWLPDRNGEVIGLQGSTRDIRERKRAEASLLESETRFRLLVDNAPDVIFVSTEQRFAYLNRAAVKLFGAASAEQILGRPVIERFHPDYHDSVRRRVHKLYVEQEPVPRIEEVCLGLDGSPITVEISAVPIVFREKRGALVFARDVEDRKRAEEQIRASLDRLRTAIGGIVQVMVNVVEMRDPYTAGHQRRVSELAVAIAGGMNRSPEEIEAIRLAGSIHDIGKIAIPSEILSKPGRLSEAEFLLMKTHPQVGFEILKGIDFPWDLAAIVHQHHERMDGSGYPQGLRGSEILMEARILAVADVVEAIATHRPYRPTLGIDPALEEITVKRNTCYDPEVVDVCLRLFREGGYRLG
ncbi:MAG TPA: PAS domain S-box protein [Syntrophales bacterium]|nr:PAS domain S-box protein [Syntrophales bacterium]